MTIQFDAPQPLPRTAGDMPFRLLGIMASSCFIGALGTDVVYARAPDMVWTTFSVWLITIGLVVAAVATVIGLIDRVLRRRVGELGLPWPYLLGFALVVVVEIFNAFVHSRDAYQSVVPEGVTLSVIAVLILLLTPFVGRALSRPRQRRPL